MTYKELYDEVIMNPEIRGKLNKVKKMAQLVYHKGYQNYNVDNKEKAIYLSIELY